MKHRLWLRLREWSQAVAHQPLLFLLVTLTGGALGVGYTCGPMHSAKNWNIDYLASQLVSQNRPSLFATELPQKARRQQHKLFPKTD